MAEIDPEILRARINGIRQWMADEAPYVAADQRHLDANTPERAYWHYGYQAALADILSLIEQRPSEEHRSHRPDRSS
jgi:hypothetical protein